MSNTYYTQVFTSDGSNTAYNTETDNDAPYVTYKCKNTVNLNFLLREVLFCDPESISVGSDDIYGTNRIHIVPTYNTELEAQADTDLNRYSDVSSLYGQYYAMRLINALMRTQSDTNEQIKLDAYLKHYGGYKNGLASGSSNNTSNPNTATVDFGEFFQVALSAVRNKETDSSQTSINGLVDRENINNAAVNGDLNQRTVDNTSASSLLRTMLTSSKKFNTVKDGQIITDSSNVNWMKQLVYSIIQNTASDKGGVKDSEVNERYRSIRRSGLFSNEHERFMQLKLKDGDTIVFTFIFNLSNADSTEFNNERPDAPGIPITVGFKVEHSDTAPEFSTSSDVIVPIGWTDIYNIGTPPPRPPDEPVDPPSWPPLPWDPPEELTVMTLLLGIGTSALGTRQEYTNDGIVNSKIISASSYTSIIKADDTVRILGQSTSTGNRPAVPYYWSELIGNNINKSIISGYTSDTSQISLLYGVEGARKIASWYTGGIINKLTMGGCPVIIQNLQDVKDIFSLDYNSDVFATDPGNNQVAIYGASRFAIHWRCDESTGAYRNVLKPNGSTLLSNVITIYPGYGAYAATIDNGNDTYDIVSFGNNNTWGSGTSGWTVTSRATNISTLNRSIQIFAKNKYSFVFYLADKSIIAWGGTGGQTNVIDAVKNWAGKTITHIAGYHIYNGFVGVTSVGDILSARYPSYSTTVATTAWGSTPVPITKMISNYDTITILASNGKIITYPASSGLTETPGAAGTVYNSSFVPINNLAVDIMSDGFLSLVKRADGTCKVWGVPGLASDDINLGGTSKIVSRPSLYGTGYNAIALKGDNSVYGWTYNDNNGIGNFAYNGMTSKLSSGINDIALSFDGYNAIAVKSDNNLIRWGIDSFNNNADITLTNKNISDVIITKGPVSDTGYCAILNDNSIKTWGSFSNGGDLSQPNWTGVDNTTALSTGVIKVKGFGTGFIALKSDNKVYLWGNLYGAAMSFWTTSISPLTVAEIYSNEFGFALLKTDGNVVGWSNELAAYTITGISGNCTSIASNQSNFCALLSTGTVFVFGGLPTNKGGATQLNNNTIAKNYVASGVTSITATNNGFVAFKNDGTAVYWGEYDSSYGIMTGITDVSEIEHFTGMRALNKTTTCLLTGGNNLTSTERNRLQLKPITKVSRLLGDMSGAVLNKDRTVDVWGAALYARYTANSNFLKNELQNIDYIATNSTSIVVRRTDGRLIIISLNGNFYPDIQTNSDINLFHQGALNSWYYIDDIIKVYSNKSVFIAVRSDYSTVTFGDYLDNGGFIPSGFNMGSVVSSISGYTDFHRNYGTDSAVHNSMFFRYNA
jgi:hypothetical protein